MLIASRVPPTPTGAASRAAGISSHGRMHLAPWLLLASLWLAPAARAQCPEAPPLANYTGGNQAVCPCFIPGEQAGVVFTAPAGDYPLEILRVGIAWASQFGGSPQSLEEAIHIYDGGLPNPGAPIFSLLGPVMTDGFINQFDLEPQPGEITVESGPFTASLEFLNQNSGDLFAPSVVHDANGCQAGKNAVYAQPGGWSDACGLGVSGDWVMFVVYRPCVPSVGIDGEERILMSQPVLLMSPRPNPFREVTELEFALARAGRATVTIFDVSGRRIATPADGEFAAGAHRVSWDGSTLDGARAAAGVYFVELRSGADRARRTVLIAQ
jgi:hypothetical protein